MVPLTNSAATLIFPIRMEVPETRVAASPRMSRNRVSFSSSVDIAGFVTSSAMRQVEPSGASDRAFLARSMSKSSPVTEGTISPLSRSR